MTQRDTAGRYAELAAGQEAVESCLLDCVAEHLNGARLHARPQAPHQYSLACGAANLNMLGASLGARWQQLHK